MGRCRASAFGDLSHHAARGPAGDLLLDLASAEFGTWKMSQNRPAADREGVVAGLAQEAPEVAALIPCE